MELPANEIAAIDAMAKRWLGIDDPGNQQELEATFGQNGQVDATTFLAIAQRLQDRGYKAEQEEDRLSILTQKNIRISLQGIGVLEKYCKDNVISNIESEQYSALRKRNNSDKDTLMIGEYSVKLKSRTEETVQRTDPDLQELLRLWPRQPKAFRLIKRWSFMGTGMRIDMSIVRSTPKDDRGQFQWRTEFLAPYRGGKTIFQQPVHYEVEVELIHGTTDTDTKEKAVKCLIRGLGEVLRAIQGNTLLIRKSVQDRVLGQYRTLNKNSPVFRGSPPVTLEQKNMEPLTPAVTKGGGEEDYEGLGLEGGADEKKENRPAIPNIRNNYNVTDKADGLRCLGFVNDEGELYLIDMAMRVYRTGLQNTACKNSLVDGEWIRKDRDGTAMNQYGIFDIFTVDKRDVSLMPFATFSENAAGQKVILNEEGEEAMKTRYGNMLRWFGFWKDKDHFKTLVPQANLRVIPKTFRFATPADGDGIFDQCRLTLESLQVYHTDGLILTPNDKPLPPMGKTFFEQFKWKPAADNTVDFLVTIEPKTRQGFNADGSASAYKELILYVNARKDPAYDNPRKTVLYMLPLPEETERDATKKVGNKVVSGPSQFIPTDPPDSMASRCYLDIQIQELTGEEYVVAENGEPIPNNSIVEMRYDITKPLGRRWIPMRIRHDKTERYTRAVEAKTGNLKQTLNSEVTANSIWSSIHNPITVSMISTGSMVPSDAEIEASTASRYYNRQASREDLEVIKGLRAFHNKYIKQQVLYGSVMKTPGLTILDLACGQAGDIYIWTMYKASVIVGVDTAMEGLRDKKNGAYARYMNFMITQGRDRVPKMLFIHGDSSKSLIDGAAGIPLNPGETEEGDMLMTVLGTGMAKGKIPPFVSKEPTEGGVRGALRDRADVASCMFALHYFFKDKDTLDGFLQNLQDCVKVGGYFIACFTDGQKVFDLLKGKKDGLAVGKEKEVNIWSIRRKYDEPTLPLDDSCLGMPVDIKFISLGEEVHTEYLVPYPYLIKRLREYGFDLLNADELKTAGLQHSTNTFDKSYDMIKKDKDEKKKYPMSPTVSAYSFTNRWLIVRRRGEAIAAEDDDGHGTSIAASVGTAEGAAIAEQVAAALKEKAEEVATNTVVREDVMTALERKIATSTVAPKAASKSASKGAPKSASKGAPKGASKKKKGGNREDEDEEEPSSEYTPENVFLFGPEVSLTANLLEREDKFYPRCLSPIWQFMIKEDGNDIVYPSLEHFWAAMKVLHGGKGPKASLKALATSFSCDGAIHNEAKERLTKEVKEKHLPSTQNQARMKIALEELNKIRKAAATIAYDDTEWAGVQDKYLRYGLEQRWKHDVEFHKTVEDLRLKNAYLLYSIGPHLGDPTGLLAGKVRKNGTIDGDNQVGKIIMELAKYRI